MLTLKEKIEKIKGIVNLNYVFFSDKYKSDLISDIVSEKKEKSNHPTVRNCSYKKNVVKRLGRPTKDDITIGLLSAGFTTIDNIVAKILEVYPEDKNRYKKDGKTLVVESTTIRRLKSYLTKEKGINVYSEVRDGIEYFRLNPIPKKESESIIILP
jgi:hypothetical protein